AFLRENDELRVGESVLRIELAPPSDRPEVPSEALSFGRLFGGSAAMRRLYPFCEKLARSNVPVLIEGETGTGKELLAEALHEAGPRANAPFVVFDCTAVPPN